MKLQRGIVGASEASLTPLEEVFLSLGTLGNATIKEIASPQGFVSELFIQEEDEWVCLLKGRVRFLLQESELELGAGAWLAIPARTPHQILEVLEPALWLAIYAPTGSGS